MEWNAKHIVTLLAIYYIIKQDIIMFQKSKVRNLKKLKKELFMLVKVRNFLKARIYVYGIKLHSYLLN